MGLGLACGLTLKQAPAILIVALSDHWQPIASVTVNVNVVDELRFVVIAVAVLLPEAIKKSQLFLCSE